MHNNICVRDPMQTSDQSGKNIQAGFSELAFLCLYKQNQNVKDWH